MIKIWKFTLFFLLCLVVALLFNLPIQHILQRVKLPDTVQLVGIDGTLLRGRAQEIAINQFPVRDLHYRYLPSCIALLKVCYRINYDRGVIHLAYDVLNGDTEVSNSQINYAVPELMAYVPPQIVQPAGKLELVIADLSYLDGIPASVNGKLIWRDLGLNDDGIKVSIGDYQVDFEGNNSGYNFVITDIGASLKVKGEGDIKPGGIYTLTMRIDAEEGVDPNVKNVLGLIATDAGYNKYRIDQKGRLIPQITRQLFK